MILKHYLKLKNLKELLVKDHLLFVQELIKASLINFPFQNITTFGKYLPCDRKTPNFKQILSASMKGEGGLCGHLNNHLSLQLQSFGFETELLAGCFRRTGIPNSHYLVKLKIPGYAVKNSELKPTDPRKDKFYLLDVGCGIPLHEPIDLDKLPYYGKAGGLQYRYEKLDDQTIQRVNECGDAILGKKPETFISPQDYTIDLVPKIYSDFGPSVHAVYSNPRSVYLHQGLYCHRYQDISKDDFSIVCIRGTDLMFITKETRHVQTFKSYQDIRPSLLKYFPMVSTEDIDLSVKHYSIPFEEALKMTSKPNSL